MKLLFWIALFVLVYWALRDKGRKQQAAARGAAEQTRAGTSAGTIEPMLQCRQCGVHFPASEAARNASGEVFCSEEHLRLSSSESGKR